MTLGIVINCMEFGNDAIASASCSTLQFPPHDLNIDNNLHGTGIVRKRPVPIPGSGMQLTNIAHVRDLSSMLTLAVENPEAASSNIFNLVSDRAVTLDGMAKLCAQAAGLPVEIVHYDPKAAGIDAKKAFPFRNMVFIFFYSN